MRAVVTVVGRDRVGIIAAVSATLARHQVNILDIRQTVMQDYFTMMMLVELEGMDIPLGQFEQTLEETGRQIGQTIHIQSEEVFQAMHHV